MEHTQLFAELNDPLSICTHISPVSERDCRQAVKPGALFCPSHAKQNALTHPVDPLIELVTETGEISEIASVAQFLSKILKLACQNRISLSRATALTFIANSLLNSLRLQKAEDRIEAKENATPEIDWTNVPRPDRENTPPCTPVPACT